MNKNFVLALLVSEIKIRSMSDAQYFHPVWRFIGNIYDIFRCDYFP